MNKRLTAGSEQKENDLLPDQFYTLVAVFTVDVGDVNSRGKSLNIESVVTGKNFA